MLTRTVTIHPGPEAEAVETIPYGEAAGIIDTLSGRPGMGAYALAVIVPATYRRSGRRSGYIAANRGSQWHTLHNSRGFVVRVNHTEG